MDRIAGGRGLRVAMFTTKKKKKLQKLNWKPYLIWLNAFRTDVIKFIIAQMIIIQGSRIFVKKQILTEPIKRAEKRQKQTCSKKEDSQEATAMTRCFPNQSDASESPGEF